MLNERKKMMDIIIRRFGLEDSRTISFVSRCEFLPLTNTQQMRLAHLFHDLLNLPIGREA